MNIEQHNPNDLVIVGLDTNDGPDHPLYDERIKLILEKPLANAYACGIKQPIHCKKVNGQLLVADGRQRVRYARELKLETVPVIVEMVSDKDASALGCLLNEARTDDDVCTKASKVAKLKAQGHENEALAAIFACSAKHITNYLKFSKMVKEVQDAVRSGDLPFAAALKWVSLPAERQVVLTKSYILRRAKVKDAVIMAQEMAEDGNAKTGGRATTMGKKELRKFCAAFLLVEPWNKDEEVCQLREMISDINDDFARGILWAIGDAPSKDMFEGDKLKAFKKLYKISTTRKANTDEEENV